jgi:hypothetical protein
MLYGRLCDRYSACDSSCVFELTMDPDGAGAEQGELTGRPEAEL